MTKKRIFIVLGYLGCMALLTFAFLLGKIYNIPYFKITGDPFLTLGGHPLLGFISNIGVLFWAITSGISIFSALFLYKLKEPKKAQFLLYAGIFTSLLLIDDLFMFHEYILISFKAFKITQPITYSIYGAFVIWFGINFIKIIMESRYLILGFSVFLLAISVLIDLFLKIEHNIKYFIEDGFKFLGLFSWMIFFVMTSYEFLSASISKSNS